MRTHEILDVINANPGISYKDLSVKTDTPLYLLHIKCNKLAKQKYIMTKKVGKERELYPFKK